MTRDPDCLFCRIVEGEIPSDRVLEEDDLLAFRDIDPKAPTHVLVIPKRHLASVESAGGDDAGLLGRLLLAAARVARDEGLDGGWRVVSNVGDDGGQSVSHLHLHVLGGRPLRWPPG